MTLSKPTNAKGCARLFLKHIYEILGESGRAMTPLEYVALASEIGLNEAQRTAAIRQLKNEFLIVYPNPATEAFTLTSKGIQEADYLKFKQQFLLSNDPPPDSLEGVRTDIEYWEQENFKNVPKSHEWETMTAKIEQLKHLENVMVQKSLVPTVYLQTGAGSRQNIGSVDTSVNYVTISETNVFQSCGPRSKPKCTTLQTNSKCSRNSKSSKMQRDQHPTVQNSGTSFQSQRNLMTIIAPFIQPLSAHIK